MGEQLSYIPSDDERVTDTVTAIPPMVLARWAAIAGERSALASLPTQRL